MANRNPLQLLVDEVEALEAEKTAIVAEIAEKMKAAARRGFSKKMIKNVLRRRKMTPEAREEEDALTQIYEGALGMLDGTPLGEAALRRLSEERKRRQEEGDDDDVELPFDGGDHAPAPGDDEIVSPEPVVEDSEDEARAKGAAAAQAGEPVLANPYAPRTKQRGWWDEAWCQASGSDGMDIPEAWRPTPKPKKGGPKPGDDGAQGPEGGEA